MAVRAMAAVGALAVIGTSAACTAHPQAAASGPQFSAPSEVVTATPTTAPPSIGPIAVASSAPSTSAPPPTTPAPTTTTPPPAASIAVHPGNGASGVNPIDPVTVSATDGTLTGVTMTNATGKKVTGKLSADKRTWSTTEVLGYSKKYTIVASAANSVGVKSSTTQSFSTLKPGNMTAAYVFPTPSTGPVGVAQIIDINFDEKIPDKAAAEAALKVTANPPTVGAWRWMSDKEVQWRPKDYWKPGTKVTVDAKIYGVKVGDGLYGQDDVQSSFTVGDDWRVVGHVDQHTIVVYHNGKVVKTLPVSYGKPSTPTHNGIHVVSTKEPLHLMNSCSYGVCGGPGSYVNYKAYWSMRISNDGEFLHVNSGTVADQGNRNVSHGCINLSMDNGKWLYDHLSIGDPVDIIGGSPELPIWDGWGGWNVSFDQWKSAAA
jgi:lipoprotein-anchoring transpeptidase ErfK/SrfK